jgi:RsiW-degrading membrane proteinase PrsW (M82 family)
VIPIDIAFFASPHLIDAILVLTAFEAAIVVLWHRRSGRGPTPAVIVRMLLPGAFLLLALRAALADAAWPWVPAALTAALVAHLIDLASRGER